MTRYQRIWIALLFAPACSLLLAGCPAPDEATGEGTETLPTGDPSLQCLRWETNCGGECVDRQSDPENCGACGNVCEGGKLCSSGTCVHNCPEGTRRCGDACVDLDTSEEHCGACDNRCANAGAEGFCRDGTCEDWVCQPDRLDSDGDVTNGCERACNGAEFPEGGGDITMDVFDVRGTVTVGGEAPEGREVGAVVFESLDTEGSAYVPIFPHDDHNYRIDLFAGRYKVRLVDDNRCNPRYSTCPGPVLRDVVDIAGDTDLDMNVDSEQPFPGGGLGDLVEVTGHITVNGAELAGQPQGGSRARVHFYNPIQSQTIYVESDGPATFRRELPSGTYRISVLGMNCGDHALPCQEKIVEDEVTITSNTDFEWDLETVELAGEVTVNGGTLPDSDGATTRGRVQLLPTDSTRTGGASAPLTASGPGEFAIQTYPGDYELWITNQSSCPGDGTEALPCTERRIADDLELDADAQRDIDLEVVTLSGEVTLNGREMTDSPATRNRGQLTLYNEVDDLLTDSQLTVRFGAAGPVEYAVKIYPGTYQADVTNSSGCDLSRPVLPCQTREIGAVEVERNQTWDVDLEVFSLNGELTLDGEQMADAEDARSRGTISILRPGQTDGPSSDLGARGPAEFSARLFGGQEYRVVLENDCNSEDSQLPCGRSTVVSSLELNDNRQLTRDLRPIELTGRLRTNGVELENLDGGAFLMLQGEHEESWIRLRNEGGSRYSGLAFPGTYRVVYQSRLYQSSGGCTSEVLPCGIEVVREGFDVRPGRSLDVDLDAVEIQGRLSYEGISVSRLNIGGRLRLRHGAIELTVPVAQGLYGPVQLLQRPFVSSFESYNCRQAGSYPCLPYLIDGCER
ncbi:MAG: hypothetical protein ACQEVA_22735 [Myxococcota bacterium]